MEVKDQNNAQLDKVAEMVGDIKFAMVTTSEPDGTLRSRPMATMEMDADGNLWFFTALSSPKIDEAERTRKVNLSYARVDKQDYVSISGTISIVRDREKMTQLWTPWIKPWFPEGLDDPNLVLLKVTPTEAEYWDAPGSSIKRAYGLTKAIVAGDTSGLGSNKKVSM